MSNWLTVPLFILAWPVALLTGNLPLTFAVFVGAFVTWRWSGGLGPADGKIAVGLAAISPLALFIGVTIEALAFLTCRLIGRRDAHLPGAIGFYLGTVATVCILVVIPTT